VCGCVAGNGRIGMGPGLTTGPHQGTSAANTLPVTVLHADPSFPRRIFFNFGRRIFQTNFLNHRLAG
jgi:hypothetical protein